MSFILENEKGKCDTCKDVKTLDSMLRKNYVKGIYHCVDCEVESIADNYDFFMSGTFNKEPVNMNRFRKLLMWCFG